MAKIALRNNGNPYLYEEVESVSSTAIGLDVSDSGKLKFVVSTSPNVTPQGVDLKLTIDPAVNGNITFTPDGLGNVVVDNGNLALTAGNFTMPFTNAAGTEGMLLVNGNSFINTLAPGNVFVGTGAGNLTLNTFSALFNTAIGSVTLQALTTGSNNVVAGSSSMQALTTGIDNIAVGTSSLRNAVSGNSNIAIGGGSAINYTGAESDNIIISNAGVLGESNAIRIGTDGSGPGQQNAAYIAGIYGVTPGGGGLNMATIDMNGQLGSQAIPAGAITTLDGNSGTASGATVNIVSDTAEGTSLITGDNASTLTLTYTGTDSNTVIGTSAFVSTYSPGVASFNTGLGALNLNSVTTGFDNTACGASALSSLTTGQENSAFGTGALSSLVSGVNNTMFGSGGLSALTSGNSNTACGEGGLAALATGSNNSVLGFNAGLNYVAAESDNIIIGNLGVLGDNNIIRIGTQGSGAGQQNEAFMAGIYNTAVGATNQVMLADSAGKLGTSIGNDGELLIGATGASPAWAGLTAGTGISITPAANAITITATGIGAFVWTAITVNQTAAVNNGYICNKAGTLALALPATAAIGDIIQVTGINTAAGWQLTQAANQQIFFGSSSTTLGATGTLTSTAIRDSISMVCVVAGASTVWNVISSIGSPAIA